MQSKFLTAEWRKLIMANYEVSPQILQKYIPKGTELDLWNNTCYVSLVGFMFLNTKVLGIPVPFHQNFEEVNLRFYVKYKEGNEWKRGVVFIKEIVPKHAIALVANSLYKEHYVAVPMQHDIQNISDILNVAYQWKMNGEWQRINVQANEMAVEIPLESEAEFISEHYWGYTKINDSETSEYQVEHPRWQMYPIINFDISCDFKAVYGEDFAEYLNAKPKSVFLAEGSEIIVRRGKTI